MRVFRPALATTPYAVGLIERALGTSSLRFEVGQAGSNEPRCFVNKTDEFFPMNVVL